MVYCLYITSRRAECPSGFLKEGNRILIRTDKLTKIYQSQGNEQVVGVDQLNIHFQKTGLHFILGKSGSGKTTLLNLLSGLDASDSGKLMIDGEEVSSYTQPQWDEFRKQNVGIVFQNFNLVPEQNVYQNVALPLKLMGVEPKQIQEEVELALRQVGLEGYGKRKISELSSGQQQRIAIARAIVKRPKILLLDEPTGNLDEANTKEVFQLLRQIAASCLVIVVSHDISNANRFGQRIIQIKDGRLVSDVQNDGYGMGELETFTLRDEKTGFCKQYEGNDSKLISDILQELILSYEAGQRKENMALTLNLDVQMKMDAPVEGKAWEQKELGTGKKKAGLAFRDLFVFSLMNFKTRKVRLAITSVLFIVVSVYTLVAATLVTYDYKETMVNYLNDNAIHQLKLSRTKYYINRLGEKKSVETNVGETYQKDLEAIAGKDRIVSCLVMPDVLNGDNWLTSVPIYVYKDFGICHVDMTGSFPTKENEIAATDYVVEAMFGEGVAPDEAIGKQIHLEDKPFYITGVIKTGYQSDDRAYSQGVVEEKYAYLYACENFQNGYRKDQSYVRIEGGDFTRNVSVDECVYSDLNYGSLNSVSGKELLWGRYPKKKNEVIVSRLFTNQRDLDYKHSKEGELVYDPIDLKADLYQNAYEQINMKDFFPEGIEIVGVYNNDAVDNKVMNAEVLVADEIYQSLEKLYYDHYFYNCFVMEVDHVDMDYVKYLEQEHITILDMGCKEIYDYVRFIKSIKKVLIILFLIATVVLAAFLISYMSYSVKDQSRKIGILRALGIPKKNIVVIFLLNVLFMTTVSLVMATFLYGFVIRELNQAFIRSIAELALVFNIITIHPLLVVEVIAMILAGSFITTYIPIHQMSKKSPITLLREEQ